MFNTLQLMKYHTHQSSWLKNSTTKLISSTIGMLLFQEVVEYSIRNLLASYSWPDS